MIIDKIKMNPYFEVVLAASFWGLTGIFIKLIDLPATSTTFFRTAVPVIILSIYFLYKQNQIFRGNYKIMLLGSLLNAIRMPLYIFGFILTSIGNAVVILYTWPIFATIYSAIFLKEKISKRNILLLATAFIGIVIVYLNSEFSFSNNDFIGMTCVLLSSIIYPLTVIIFKKEANNFSKTETLFYQNIVGSLAFLPFVFINKPLPNIEQIGLGALFGIVIGLISFGLFFSALKKIKASTASFLAYIEVVSAIVLSSIIFQDIISINTIIGGALIIISTILLKK